MVGRDILIGGLASLVSPALYTLGFLLPIWMGLPPELPVTPSLVPFVGVRQYIGTTLDGIPAALILTAVSLFLLMLLRLLLRKQWAAATALVVLFLLPEVLFATNPAITVPLYLLGVAGGVFVLIRFGFLAYLSLNVFHNLLYEKPCTWDLSAWYAGRFLVPASVAIALAIYAFRIALAGRPVFRSNLFEGGGGRNP